MGGVGRGACAVSLNSILSLQHTFEEAEKGFDETLAKEKGMNRDDRIHGALLILNELVRISSMEGEVSNASGGQGPGPVLLSQRATDKIMAGRFVKTHESGSKIVGMGLEG